MPPKRSKAKNAPVQVHEDPFGGIPAPPTLNEVAEMAGYWPGMGAVLYPKDVNVPCDGSTEKLEIRVRTTKSVERELMDNFKETDSAGSWFSMMTGGQRRFLESLAEDENARSKMQKRQGDKYQVEESFEESYPKVPPFEPHLAEKVLGYSKNGEPDLEVRCSWAPTQIRSKVQRLLQCPDSSLNISQLCEQMETTREQYREYMTKKNLDKGDPGDFYIKACYFFAKKEEGFVAVDRKASKKRKSSEAADGENAEKAAKNDAPEADHADKENGSNKRPKRATRKSKAKA